MVKISLSILDADFSCLRNVLNPLMKHVDSIHVDIMDGSITPEVSFGLWILETLRSITDMKLETHLYTNRQMELLDSATKFENTITLLNHRTLAHLFSCEIYQSSNVLGLYLLPEEEVQDIAPEVFESIKLVNVVTVESIQGGQPISWSTMSKIDQLDRIRRETGHEFEISVDGGVNKNTLPSVLAYPIQQIVVGSAILKSTNPLHSIKELKRTIKDTH